MTISCVDPSSAAWQTFVESHPNSRIFHTSGWLEALRRTYGYEPIVYAASNGRSITSGIPFCRIRSRLTGRRLVSLPFSDHCQPLVAETEQFRDLLAAAKADAE